MSAAYETPTVKPHDPKDPRPLVSVLPEGQLELRGISLRGLIFMANPSKSLVAPGQIVDGPSWLDSDLFDIAARTDGSPVGPDGYTAATISVLQRLVADQFKVALQRGSRDLSAYELVLTTPGKLGPNIAPFAGGAASAMMMESGGVVEVINPDPTAGLGWQRTITINQGIATIEVQAKGVTMFELALHFALSPLNAPVIDRTGLSGQFTISSMRYTQTDLRTVPSDRYALSGAQARGAAQTTSTGGADAETLSKALTEQLGMRLQPTTASLDVLVVQSAARPSMN